MKTHICWCVIDYTLMVIDYQRLISKNTFPKVTILQVTCFWRFFQKSQLFKWLVLKKLPRVTSFDLSYQEIINMWPMTSNFLESIPKESFHLLLDLIRILYPSTFLLHPFEHFFSPPFYQSMKVFWVLVSFFHPFTSRFLSRNKLIIGSHSP